MAPAAMEVTCCNDGVMLPINYMVVTITMVMAVMIYGDDFVPWAGVGLHAFNALE